MLKEFKEFAMRGNVVDMAEGIIIGGGHRMSCSFARRPGRRAAFFALARLVPATTALALLAFAALVPGPVWAQEQRLSSDWQSPETCGYCHDALYEQFTGSMHSQAAVDPLYLYEVALADEQTDGLVGPFCLKCHSPIGDWLGETAPPTGKSDGSALSDIAKEGVTCDFCHTVSGPSDEWPGNSSFESDPGLTKRGPYADSVSPAHDTAFSEFHTSSDFCGSCHDVNHPLNGLALEATYTEWKESGWADLGVRCQDCHMTPGAGPSPPGTGPVAAFGPERDRVFSMDFTGANAVFGNREAAEERLKGAAALELIVEGVPEAGVKAGDPVKALVKVKNVAAGHYLPTGLTDTRRMWLEVKAVGKSGDPVELGKVEYHTIFADESGNHENVPVWFAASVYYDRRVPPMGALDEVIEFAWPEGVSGEAKVVAELKYMSFTQELADKAKLDVEVPVILMAQTEQSVETAGSSLMAAIAFAVAFAVVVAIMVVFLRRRPGGFARRGGDQKAVA
ncbi:MAG: MscL family protein [Actinobacteria bacterium]|nr:MscL family protein [Actinomycetota bacterium]